MAQASKGFLPKKHENKGRIDNGAKLGVGLSNEVLKPKPKDLFSILEEFSPETRAEIERAQVESESLNIKLLNDLNGAQQKAIWALASLLNIKSETSNIESPEYYLGSPDKKVFWKSERAPAFFCSLHEFTRIFIGDKDPSGANIKRAYKVLESLANQKFAFKWEEKYKANKKSDPVKRIIKGYRPLITIDQETIELKNGSKKQGLAISMNPIFIEGFKRGRFILIPHDIIKRMQEATGSPKALKSHTGLINYFLHNLSSRDPIENIRLSKLYEKIDQRKAKKNRKQLKEELIGGLEICIKMNLILEYEIKTGQTGELKLYFKLNRNYI